MKRVLCESDYNDTGTQSSKRMYMNRQDALSYANTEDYRYLQRKMDEEANKGEKHWSEYIPSKELVSEARKRGYKIARTRAKGAFPYYIEPVESSTSINSSEDSGGDKLEEAIDILKEDFDYIISGLERLDRQGANGSNDALMIVENLSSDLQGHLSEIAAHINE